MEDAVKGFTYIRSLNAFVLESDPGGRTFTFEQAKAFLIEKHDSGFRLNWDNPMQALILDDELSNQAWRVFSYLLTITKENDNQFTIKQRQLASRFGIKSRSTISSIFKTLQSKNMIFRMNKDGNDRIYAINPHISFRGEVGAKRFLIARIKKEGYKI